MTFEIADCRLQIADWIEELKKTGLPARLRLVALLLLISLVGVARSVEADELIDRVLAVAAGDVILLSDVIAARDFGLVAPGEAADPVREILTRLIDRALVLAEVNRYAPPEPDAAEVDRALAEVRARFPTAEAFAERLARAGLTGAHLRETLRGDLRIRAYLEQRFTVAPPGDGELLRYYQEHGAQFTRNGQPAPFEDVRLAVMEAAVADRRRALANEWIAGIRRRADIIDLYR
jgi:hypothetical protein